MSNYQILAQIIVAASVAYVWIFRFNIRASINQLLYFTGKNL